MKRLLPYLFPIALLLYLCLGFLICPHTNTHTWWQEHDYLDFLPYVLLALIFVLAYAFRVPGLAPLAIVLAAAYYSLNAALSEPQDTTALHATLAATVLMIPIAFLFSHLFWDQPVHTPGGALFFAFGLVWAAVFVMLAQNVDAPFSQRLVQLFATLGLRKGFSPAAVPVGGLLLNTALVSLVHRQRSDRQRLLFLLSLLCALFGLGAMAGLASAALQKPALAAFFAGTGALLVYAVLEFSWHSAYIDALTELPSRRALNDVLSAAGGNLVVAMVDIDHFKRINDAHGHQIGDQVLQFVAARLTHATGQAYRYGGEEFAILFRGRSAEEARTEVETLRKDIRSTEFIVRSDNRTKRKPKSRNSHTRGGKRIPVTVSVGVAQRSNRHSTPTEILAAADQALYQAKRKGRNRTVVSKQ